MTEKELVSVSLEQRFGMFVVENSPTSRFVKIAAQVVDLLRRDLNTLYELVGTYNRRWHSSLSLAEGVLKSHDSRLTALEALISEERTPTQKGTN